MAVFRALPPPARRQERHLADRLLELMHRGHRHREERRRQEAAEQRAVLAERALQHAVHEVDGEQRIRALAEYGGEQAQQRRDDEHALQRAVYFSSPSCSICWYMRT